MRGKMKWRSDTKSHSEVSNGKSMRKPLWKDESKEVEGKKAC